MNNHHHQSGSTRHKVELNLEIDDESTHNDLLRTHFTTKHHHHEDFCSRTSSLRNGPKA
jgi:hypothetical protein